MTKTEEKLKALGYERFALGSYTKKYKGCDICISLKGRKIYRYYVIFDQSKVCYDNLQCAHNEMRKDLAMLKERKNND